MPNTMSADAPRCRSSPFTRVHHRERCRSAGAGAGLADRAERVEPLRPRPLESVFCRSRAVTSFARDDAADRARAPRSRRHSRSRCADHDPDLSLELDLLGHRRQPDGLPRQR